VVGRASPRYQEPGRAFAFPEYASGGGRQPTAVQRALQPDLNYLAPEYILTKTYDQASDLYSFGHLMYACFNRGQVLFECHGNVLDYQNNMERVSRLQPDDIAGVPPKLRQVVSNLVTARLAWVYVRKPGFTVPSTLGTALCSPAFPIPATVAYTCGFWAGKNSSECRGFRSPSRTGHLAGAVLRQRAIDGAALPRRARAERGRQEGGVSQGLATRAAGLAQARHPPAGT